MYTEKHRKVVMIDHPHVFIYLNRKYTHRCARAKNVECSIMIKNTILVLYASISKNGVEQLEKDGTQGVARGARSSLD